MSKIKNPVVLIHKRENSDTYAVAITSGSQDYHDAILMATMEPDMTGDDVDTWSKIGYYMAAETAQLRQRVAELKASISLASLGDESQRNPVLAYADSYRDMAKQGVESIPVWSVITDLERNIAPLYAAPPAQGVPATLPCAVELKPGFVIGKGCKTETLLIALQRRADYCAEIDAMTPEERANHDANIEAFKAMLPAPAVSANTERTTTRRSAEHKARLSEASNLLTKFRLVNDVTNGKQLTITLPALPVLGSREEWYQGFAAGAGSMREECAAALISAGIGVEVK